MTKIILLIAHAIMSIAYIKTLADTESKVTRLVSLALIVMEAMTIGYIKIT